MCNGAVEAERARHPLNGGCERLPLDICLCLSGEGLHSRAQLLLALDSDQAICIQDPEIGGGLLICQALQTRPPSVPYEAGHVVLNVTEMPKSKWVAESPSTLDF